MRKSNWAWTLVLGLSDNLDSPQVKSRALSRPQPQSLNVLFSTFI